MIKKNHAFTLIELLVVIAIIGILATISVISLQNVRAKARDARRVADVKQIQIALELYFSDVGRYPTAAEFNLGSLYSTSSNGTTTYMVIIPTAPNPPDGNCDSQSNVYLYSQQQGGSDYSIDYCLGGKASLDAGLKCATSDAILDRDCCSAFPIAYEGGPYDADGISTTTGGYYRAVRIGHQCWTKDNLNIGQMIYNCSNDGGITPADYCDGLGNHNKQDNDNVIEKYCWGNNIVNPDLSSSQGCNTDGGLYQWAEAMALPSSCNNSDCSSQISLKHRGICPIGWHIPTDAEWHAVEYYLSAEPKCDSTHSNNNCLSAGNKMLKRFDNPFVGYNGCHIFNDDCGASGLDIISGGYTEWAGAFSYLNWYTKYLSATQTNDSQVAIRMFDKYQTGIYYYSDTYKGQGFFVRCIKD